MGVKGKKWDRIEWLDIEASRKKRRKRGKWYWINISNCLSIFPFSHPKSWIRSIFGFVQECDSFSTVKNIFRMISKIFSFLSLFHITLLRRCRCFLSPITPPRRLQYHSSLEIRNQNHQYEKPQKRWESSQLEALHYYLGAESSKKIINFHFSNSSSILNTYRKREHEILIRDLTCNLPLVSRIRPNHQPEISKEQQAEE